MTDTTNIARAPEEHPPALGAGRLADLMAARFGVPVEAADIATLAKNSALTASGAYKGWPLYPVADALALDAELVGAVVTERRAWVEASLPRDEAAQRIGWHWRDIERLGLDGRLTVGQSGRYPVAELDRLAVDGAGERWVTAQEAADELEIRPIDFRYVEAAGWVGPVSSYERPVGTSRSVTVQLYLLADVWAVRERTDIDWESVRGLAKGAPSPLREYAVLGPSRAEAVRAFAQQLADEHQVTVWAWCSPYSGEWELDWERPESAPAEAEVRRALGENPRTARYAQDIVLGPRWGALTREARRLLEPGVAVVLDTETTSLSGQVIELAVVDVHSGQTLLDTLVAATEPVTEGARRVHGITDEDLVDAKPWEKVLPRLRKVTRGKIICAYNADFDRGRILGDCERAGRKPRHLEPWDSWHCLMDAYASWMGSNRWLRLGGTHRALGDCASAREVLTKISQGRGTQFSPARVGSSVPAMAVPLQPRGGDRQAAAD
ncbi:3'-5' exonuclease [Streptomyces albidoflavus]